jgi:hypothetical protein
MTDEELWSRYAAAAMTALIQTMYGDPSDADVTENVGLFADAMLAEHHDRFRAATSLPAPDVEAQAFTVGDRVTIRAPGRTDDGRGGVVQQCEPHTSAPYLVRLSHDGLAWYRADELVHADAPAVEAQGGALSEGDARLVEVYAATAPIGDKGQLYGIASRIRTTLANGAGEAERLRAERDQYLRALESVAPEGATFQLTLPDQNDLPMYGRIALVSPPWIATEANDDGTFDVNHETYDEDTCHGETEQVGFFVTEEWLADREEERDSLRAELDDERREHKTTRAMWKGLLGKIEELRDEVASWRAWCSKTLGHGRWDCDVDGRAAIDAKLAESEALRWSDALPSRESYARAVAVTVRVRRG